MSFLSCRLQYYSTATGGEQPLMAVWGVVLWRSSSEKESAPSQLNTKFGKSSGNDVSCIIKQHRNVWCITDNKEQFTGSFCAHIILAITRHLYDLLTKYLRSLREMDIPMWFSRVFANKNDISISFPSTKTMQWTYSSLRRPHYHQLSLYSNSPMLVTDRSDKYRFFSTKKEHSIYRKQKTKKKNQQV